MGTRTTLLLLTSLGFAQVGIDGCSSKSNASSTDAGQSSTFPDDAATTGTSAEQLAVECFDPDAGLMANDVGIFSPTDFCTLYLATCTGSLDGYGDMNACLQGYVASAALADGDQRHCRSYHVCNASTFDPSRVQLHCGHAAGILLCN